MLGFRGIGCAKKRICFEFGKEQVVLGSKLGNWGSTKTNGRCRRRREVVTVGCSEKEEGG